MDLCAAGRGVGKQEASAKAESEAGGFEGVAAGGDVVHETGLAEGQRFADAGEVVLVGGIGPRASRQRQLFLSAGDNYNLPVAQG